jgi:hypothetical protein
MQETCFCFPVATFHMSLGSPVQSNLITRNAKQIAESYRCSGWRCFVRREGDAQDSCLDWQIIRYWDCPMLWYQVRSMIRDNMEGESKVEWCEANQVASRKEYMREDNRRPSNRRMEIKSEWICDFHQRQQLMSEYFDWKSCVSVKKCQNWHRGASVALLKLSLQN